MAFRDLYRRLEALAGRLSGDERAAARNQVDALLRQFPGRELELLTSAAIAMLQDRELTEAEETAFARFEALNGPEILEAFHGPVTDEDLEAARRTSLEF